MSDNKNIIRKALNLEWLSVEEALEIYIQMPFAELMQAAHTLRKKLHPDNIVSWIIDRNVNITNVCVSGCEFCNFHRPLHHCDSFITTNEQYSEKIKELFDLGGNQLLLQGGMHPKLKLLDYMNLFSGLKKAFPEVRLHALGPPEIVFLAKQEGITYKEVLTQLMQSGLDSLPGAGAEILDDSIRKQISKGKCSASEWFEVMRVAHTLRLTTTATMMFGHIETKEQRIRQLADIRQVQSEKPQDAKGFISFIPWTFQSENTVLAHKHTFDTVSDEEYIRTIAISRLMLPNVPNIQPSWLTVGKQIAQLCLWAGANDLGSVMIEEHVVSAAGAKHRISIEVMKDAIKEAGFTPMMRNQQFKLYP
ncbi:MAG: CofH family radical SAM protein [Bacteroidota bacterium]